MEAQMDKELEDKMSELDKKKRREKKKERKKKSKLRQRVSLGMEVPDDGGVTAQDGELFSVASVLRKQATDLVLDQAPDEVLESPEDSEEGTFRHCRLRAAFQIEIFYGNRGRMGWSKL